jgi:hypothetical protein
MLDPTDVEGHYLVTTSGATFDRRGREVGGAVRGRQLEAVRHVETFWLVPVVSKPDTELVATVAARAATHQSARGRHRWQPCGSPGDSIVRSEGCPASPRA